MKKVFDISFVDLDDTLFDTKKFKEDIYKVFAPLGITHADFIRAYRSAAELKQMGYFHYTFEKQVETVRAAGYAAGPKQLNELQKLLRKNYRIKGDSAFIGYLKSICGRVILLTAGTKEFQMKKIKAIKIADLFDKIIQIQGGKDKVLRPYVARKKQILFINDNLDENMMIKRKYKNVEVVTLFNSSYWKINDCNKSKIPFFKNYTQIKNYLNSL